MILVNGITLPGYIYIGLIDSMLDMLLETAGAIVICVVLWLDKGRHPLIQAIERKINREKRDKLWQKDM